MKNFKNCILAISGVFGAVAGMLTALFAIAAIENKVNVCHIMKKKAKKAFKLAEENLEI